MTSTTSPSIRKISLFALTAMVVGLMVGAGIFSLPGTFGVATGPFGAILAWCIVGGGMYMLVRVFQTLAARKPDLDAGVYAYAKAGFGDYPGFLSAFGYWIGSCINPKLCPRSTRNKCTSGAGRTHTQAAECLTPRSQLSQAGRRRLRLRRYMPRPLRLPRRSG